MMLLGRSVSPPLIEPPQQCPADGGERLGELLPIGAAVELTVLRNAIAGDLSEFVLRAVLSEIGNPAIETLAIARVLRPRRFRSPSYFSLKAPIANGSSIQSSFKRSSSGTIE